MSEPDQPTTPDGLELDRPAPDQSAPDEAIEDRLRAAFQAVTRSLPGRAPVTPADALQGLVDAVPTLSEPDLWDTYAQRGPVAELEARVAELLGKPAAAVFPSGVMAQQSLLRVWTDRQGCRRIALPALSHLLHHELDGPRLLHGFRYEHLTEGARVPLTTDLAAIPGELGAVLLELPLREGGYLLPNWDELSEFAAACRDRHVPLHFDGARIWESAPYLGHGLDEIAALADSVYVSFYKGLRGLSGAAVAGPADVIAEARQWRTRHGGTLFTLLPNAVSALAGLREELPRMHDYHQRAIEIAALLPERGIRVWPEPPHTNAFRIVLPETRDVLLERLATFMEKERVALCPPFQSADVPGWSWTEFTVGSATMDWPPSEAADLLARLLEG